MPSYKIFHLPDNQDKTLLLKQRPRFDPTIVEAYCISKEQLNNIEDNRQINEKSCREHMNDIAKIARTIWDTKKYIHVANVKAKDIVQAVRNTNNINGHWFLTVTKGVEIISNETQRGSCLGDIIQDVQSQKLYILYAFTFLELETGELLI